MDILDYDDYRKFLTDWFAAHPEVSHRGFMRRVGSRDPNVLLRIIKGERRLTEDRVPVFARALELDEVGTEALWLLVRIAHGRAPRSSRM